MLRHYRLGTNSTSESMSSNGVARLSTGPTVMVSPLPEQPPGILLRRKATSLRPALQLSWSTTGWTISTRWSKPCAKKAATSSRRLTIPSTGNSDGSSIQRATKLNFGNHRPANEAQRHADRRVIALTSPYDRSHVAGRDGPTRGSGQVSYSGRDLCRVALWHAHALRSDPGIRHHASRGI